MAIYRYADLESGVDEMVVIEDRSLFCRNDAGDWAPGLEFIASRTLRAHLADYRDPPRVRRASLVCRGTAGSLTGQNTIATLAGVSCPLPS